MNKKKILFPVLLFLLLCSVRSDTKFYASDEAGIVYQEVASGKQKSIRYIISIEKDASFETRRLLLLEHEIRRWEREFYPSGSVSKEQVYIEGLLDESSFYNSQGLIEKHDVFENGLLITRKEYIYSGSRLDHVFTKSENGTPLFIDRFFYNKDGSLKRIDRDNDGAKTISTIVDIKKSRLLRTWSGNTSGGTLESFDSLGRLLIKETFQAEKLQTREVFQYTGDGNYPSESIQENISENFLLIRKYQESGFLVSEAKLVNGKQLEKTEYKYDEDSRLIQITLAMQGKKTSEIRQYEKTGFLLQSTLFENNQLQKSIEYEPNEIQIETWYSDDKPVLKKYVEKGKLMREEIFRNGEIIRTIKK